MSDEASRSDSEGSASDSGSGGGRDSADDGGPTAEAGGRPCPICETPMYHRHCKYVCPNHGVIMDCADTFY